MNISIFTGRLVKMPKLEVIGDKKKMSFNLAVKRDFKNSDGEYDADFPLLIAWNNNAEFISKYAKKGDLIEVYAEYRTEKKEDKFYKWFNVRKVSMLSHAKEKSEPQANDYEEIPTENFPADFNFEDNCSE